jgi:hypothetical protein
MADRASSDSPRRPTYGSVVPTGSRLRSAPEELLAARSCQHGVDVPAFGCAEGGVRFTQPEQALRLARKWLLQPWTAVEGALDVLGAARQRNG